MKKLVFWTNKEHNSLQEGKAKMENKNSEQKSVEKPEEWSLTRYKAKYIDKHTKFRSSGTFGKKDHWIIRATNTTVDAVVYFFSGISQAIKIIIKEVM